MVIIIWVLCDLCAEMMSFCFFLFLFLGGGAGGGGGDDLLCSLHCAHLQDDLGLQQFILGKVTLE